MLSLITILTICAFSTSTSAQGSGSVLSAPLIGSDIHLTISTWPAANCPGDPTAKDVVVPYGNNTIPGSTIVSYRLSRTMLKGEQLDFSTWYGNNHISINGQPPQCSFFVEQTSPDTYGHPLIGNTCYNFLNGHTAQVNEPYHSF